MYPVGKPLMTPVRPSKPLIVVILVAAVACGDPYAHTNPYDPLASVEITISGPDTLFTKGEIGQYTALTVPAFPDSALDWGSADNDVLASAGSGQFQDTFRTPLWPATATIRLFVRIGAIDTVGNNAGALGPAPPITVWRHIGYKDVVVTQR